MKLTNDDNQPLFLKIIEEMYKLTSFKITKLYGTKNFAIKFKDNSLILVGENGAGKTTVLRILYYSLTGQWKSLAKYNFESVELEINTETFTIKKKDLSILDFPCSASNSIKSSRSASGNVRWSLHDLYKNCDLTFPEFENLIEEDKLPIRTLMDLFDNSKEFQNKNKELNKKLQSVINITKELQILYLPTYRRIEQELGKIFSGINEDELRHNKRTSDSNPQRNYTELIEFGMKDVDRSIELTLGKLKDFARESLNTLTLGYLGDVVDKKYSEVDLAQIKAASEETIKNVLDRIENKILSDDSKKHLSETIANVKKDEELNEHAKVICHYFIKLLNFQQELGEKEEKIRSFCKVCNNYMEDKIIEYTSSSFSYKIVPEIKVKADDEIKLDQLSSGEKQVISLFSHLYLSEQKHFLVMIDEPELSLSVPWQRRFLVDVKNGDFCEGIVVVTHSPFIYDNELSDYAHGLGEFLTLES